MVDKPFEKRIRRDGREEGLQGKHYCFSSPIHMQLLFPKRLTRDRNKAMMTHVLVQDCNKVNIKKEKLEEYELYKVFDGLHSQLLPKPCTKNTPENAPFKDRSARVYCGLSTEEVLWLVSRHNVRAVMHNVISSRYW